MLEFKILKKSKNSNARLGVLKTSHGVVETPVLVTVATQAVVKTLTSEEVKQAKSQLLIANTFHLHLKPGEKIVKSFGGLHKFMNWDRPLMTDSGGFQVFSLGFGSDHGVGKIFKRDANIRPIRQAQGRPEQVEGRMYANDTNKKIISKGQQPRNVKITSDGVFFNSPVDGRKIFLGPKESMKIQQALGADIIFAFDECTSPLADYEYTKKSLVKTHRWAKICLENKPTKQALFGITQGGKFKDLRIESAKFIGSLPFDGFGIGGEFGGDKDTMIKMIGWTIKELPSDMPRHLLGIGHLEDIPKIIKSGVDTFDCIVPTHYARHGYAFTSEGRLDISKAKFLNDKKPLDKKCGCFVCQNYSRGYITHLLKAKEITPLKLLTFHNLYFFNSYIEKLRNDIKEGRL
ncbi:MAG: tRNA guanosine(34) transglycosylase Tgt [Candidatus Wolfebacteria bacterium]|nr:tRNA guanosine(34) transglycosylase Tgt [Candidatus Wolfebacteria bacterium]